MMSSARVCIHMSCINPTLRKRRSYEIIVDQVKKTIITRWGRIGQERKRTKKYALSDEQGMMHTLRKLLLTRVKHGYQYDFFSSKESEINFTPILHLQKKSTIQLLLF